MPRVYDISILLHPDLPTFPGEPGPGLRLLTAIALGAEANVSVLTIGTHTGTHLDAPFHFLTGTPTVDTLSLETLVGPALVTAIDVETVITPRHLEAIGLPNGTARLLLKTRNSELWGRSGFQEDFVGLSVDAARWLVERQVRLIGIDYLSIEPFRGNGDTHRTLLAAGVVILEGLDLRSISPGQYSLVCLPLKLPGADGSPVRAVLLAD